MSLPPDTRLELLPPADRVDLWIVRAADFSPGVPDRLTAGLSPEETAHADRFVNPADAELYRLAHGMLRTALTHYFGGAAASWRFVAEPGGKPALAAPTPIALAFNLSHSAGVAVAAFTGAGSVGVDIEPLTRAIEVVGLIPEQFHPAECAWLAAGSAAQRGERVVWLWTAHEALLKACGRGMATPSRSIAIEWHEPLPPRVRVAPPEVGLAWQLVPFRMAPGLAGTIVLPDATGSVTLNAIHLAPGAAGPQPSRLVVSEPADGYRNIEFP